jgi:hypothetical protein
MPFDLGYHPPPFLPALRRIAEAGVIATHLMRRRPTEQIRSELLSLAKRIMSAGATTWTEAHANLAALAVLPENFRKPDASQCTRVSAWLIMAG